MRKVRAFMSTFPLVTHGLLKTLRTEILSFHKIARCACIPRKTLPAGVTAPSCTPPTYPGRNLWQKSGMDTYKNTLKRENIFTVNTDKTKPLKTLSPHILIPNITFLLSF